MQTDNGRTEYLEKQYILQYLTFGQSKINLKDNPIDKFPSQMFLKLSSGFEGFTKNYHRFHQGCAC